MTVKVSDLILQRLELGDIVSSSDLMAHVWHDESKRSSGALRVHIHKLRCALAGKAKIENTRGKYQLIKVSDE